jgi:ATP-dependent phosphofructokinase / diphosphate-dependent phosphofructokinase
MLKRIGILTGGGDCPGLNPAVKWVVKTALDEELSDARGTEYEVIGIRDGWKGIVKYDPRFPVLPASTPYTEKHFARVLTESEVRTWDRHGGTRLGSSRTNPFRPGQERWKEVVANYKSLGLSALVAIGGDDTLGIASKLSREGLNIVCIPKTIDRDLQGTDYTLGFETAVNVIVEEVDRIRTTAHSHSRAFVVETMGRYTGHLALAGGLAAGAPIILIPEVPYEPDRVIQLLKDRRKAGHRSTILVVAEGAQEAGGKRHEREACQADGFGHPTLGGIAKRLERQLEQGTGLEVRSVELSHLQRGGVPNSYDRRIARLFGIGAVDLIQRGEYGRMVVWTEGLIQSIPIPTDLKNVRKVNVDERYDKDNYCAKKTIFG